MFGAFVPLTPASITPNAAAGAGMAGAAAGMRRDERGFYGSGSLFVVFSLSPDLFYVLVNGGLWGNGKAIYSV